jgi:ribonuclease HI
MIKKDNIVVFTDGSCKRKKNSPIKCGYGIYFPNKELQSYSRPYLDDNLTNQRAELYAIYKAIRAVTHAFEFNTLNIYTDSEYSIKSLTVWINGWKKNNWKSSGNKDVMNQDIIKKIDEYMQKYKNKIIFHHVRAHTGKSDYNSQCNAIVDKLASDGADKS